MRKRASSSVYKMKFNSLFDRVTRRRRRARLSGNKHNLEFDRVTRKRARMSQNKGDPKSKDRISQFPDELLITILSLLSLKVAGATSILSRRWRNLWTYTRGMFFDSYTIPLLYQCADERMEYINWVNLVLKNHRSATIDSFKICFDLQRSSTSDINRWIKFAIQKQVQSLEVDLLMQSSSSFFNYRFTEKLLTQLKGLSSKRLCTSFGITFLKELHLKRVNMSDKTLKSMLVCFTALQSLSLHGVSGLVDIKISGQYLKLRALEIVSCMSLNNIEICDTKLVSFTYLGPGRNVVLKDVPNLKEVFVQQGRSGLKNFVRTLQNCFHQIQVLSLLIHSPEERIGFEFPKLHNVKQLSLEIGAWDDVCLLHFTSLVEACPFLDTFKLKLLWKSPANSQRKIRQAANFPHKHLRLVEICGYYGRASDAELALYFIENAVMLNTMVIYPREHIEEVPFSQFMLNIARNHAKQHIAPKVPAGVELVIL